MVESPLLLVDQHFVNAVTLNIEIGWQPESIKVETALGQLSWQIEGNVLQGFYLKLRTSD